MPMRTCSSLSDRYYNNTKIGQIMGRITNDLFDVTEFSHHCPEEFFIAGVKALVSFILLARINLALTVIIFAPSSRSCSCAVSGSTAGSAVLSAGSGSRSGNSTPGSRTAFLASAWSRPSPMRTWRRTSLRRTTQKFLDIKKDTYLYMGIFKVLRSSLRG